MSGSRFPSSTTSSRIGLALSGGGFRAAAFHLGVLRRLAEDGLFERVSVVSTVSGGSLVTAAIFATAGNLWPTSREFLDVVYPQVVKHLTSVDLLSLRGLGLRGVLRFNARLIGGRASVLRARLEEAWGIKARLYELPESPTWWINATCIETGKNWRFSKRRMGDWTFGAHLSPPGTVAEAAAASAAVPYAIGALSMRVPENGWHEADPASKAIRGTITPPTRKVRLWDGGAYENMGLEPVLKADRLVDCDVLICSDASASLPSFRWPSPFALVRGGLWSPRLYAVAGDQIRALRSRQFVQAMKQERIAGALLRMGNSARALDLKLGQRRREADYDAFSSDEDVRLALSEPSGLRALDVRAFARIARHGHEVADVTAGALLPSILPGNRRWAA